MTETHEPDLSNLKPVNDIEASHYIAAETHTWLSDSITNEPTNEQRAAHGNGFPSPRRGPRPLESWRGGYWRGAPRRVMLATVLAATVVALIVLLPGLLTNDGSVTQPAAAQAQILHRISTALSRRPATILIQRMRTQFLSSQPGEAPKSTFGPVTSLIIDEASRDGSVQRSFSTSSETRPGFEQLSAGNSLQTYDPLNNTIYETTVAAWKAAVVHSFKFPPLSNGPHSGSSSTFYSYSSPDSTGPGQLSVFEQQLRQHLYRLGKETTVDGRPALTLVPVQSSIKVSSTGSGSAREYLGTVYVSPTTYYPIKEVTPVPPAGSPLGTGPRTVTTIVDDWSEYTILTVNQTNVALVSLTARHPHAQIVHGATGYLRVSAIESHH